MAPRRLSRATRVKKSEARRRKPRAATPRGAAAWHTRGVRSLRRPLGSTGLLVAPLGLGGGPLGDLGLSDDDAARVIDTALDAGVDLIDTAPSYGASEDRVGRALRGRRDRVVLVTKGGYGVPGVPDWSPAVIARGVDQALARLGTDYLDVFLLHSCDRARLEVGDLIEPLVAARAAGKVRAIGYAGDGDALAWAVRCPDLDVVECSVNLVDQRALADAIPTAIAAGKGVLAKRGLAGAPWLPPPTDRDDLQRYRTRWLRMFDADAPAPAEAEALAVRFAAFAPGVAAALIGTRRAASIARAAAHASAGPLDAATVAALRARFAAHDDGWHGVI